MKRWMWVVLAGLFLAGPACASDRVSRPGEQKTDDAAARSGEAVTRVAPPAVSADKDDRSPRQGAPEPMIEGKSALQDPPGDRPLVPPLPEVTASQARVIKNANLEVRVRRGSFQEHFKRAAQAADEFGGYVSNTSVNEVKGKISSGTITVRVPSERFQAALNRLKALGRVTAESQSGQDVTREFVDLEARLRHARSQETFFLRLLDESKSISDMLAVQQQLTNVQLQIEQIQGQLQYLKDQTGFSTITARIYEPGAAAGNRAQPLANAWKAAIDAFQKVAGGFVVAVGWVAPFGILAAAGAVAWKILHRSKNKPAAPSVP